MSYKVRITIEPDDDSAYSPYESIDTAHTLLDVYSILDATAQSVLSADIPARRAPEEGACDVCEAQPWTQHARYHNARICADCASTEPNPQEDTQ